MFGTVGMAQVAVMNNGFNIMRRGGASGGGPDNEGMPLLAILLLAMLLAIPLFIFIQGS